MRLPLRLAGAAATVCLMFSLLGVLIYYESFGRPRGDVLDPDFSNEALASRAQAADAASWSLWWWRSSSLVEPEDERVLENKGKGGRAATAAAEEEELGEPIMGSYPNATLRAELGRSTWHLLHTMAARLPEKLNADQRTLFVSFVGQLSRLYPCGECARDFQGLLKRHPVKAETRDDAVQWACELHNKVNEKLHKPQFDCAEAYSRWDCGCGPS